MMFSMPQFDDFFSIIAGNGRKGRLPFVKELWLDMKKVLIPLHGLNKYILDPIPRKSKIKLTHWEMYVSCF